MKITQLPSGNYNIRTRIDGRVRSFTSPSKREVTRLANEAKYASDRTKEVGITLGEAVDKYIESKKNVLSPATIQGYQRYKSERFQNIQTVPVGLITNSMLQDAINAECGMETMRGKKVSSKTVINAFGLLSASLRNERPDFYPRVTLPKKIKKYKDLPTPEEVIRAIKGTNIELPALLAMWMSLTVSEIRGIKVSSIRDGVLYIEESVVQIDGTPVHKEAAKAYDRNRKNRIPPYIMDLISQTEAWQNGEGYIEPRSGQAIHDKFHRVAVAAKLKPITFHDLRHLFASVGLQLNIPEKYLMEKGGWSTPHVMKSVYQHTFASEMEKSTDKIDSYFQELIDKA